MKNFGNPSDINPLKIKINNLTQVLQHSSSFRFSSAFYFSLIRFAAHQILSNLNFEMQQNYEFILSIYYGGKAWHVSK